MRSGVSARGEWKSQEFVITTEEQYPKMVCFQVFGEDKINSFALQIGEVVKVSFDISAHEYQGAFLILSTYGKSRSSCRLRRILLLILNRTSMLRQADMFHHRQAAMLCLAVVHLQVIRRIRFRPDSRRNNKAVGETFPFNRGVELIKRTFNAYVVQPEKCV